MNSKKTNRLRRARKTRYSVRNRGQHRLCVHRTPRHIYAQIIAPDAARTLACAATVEKEIAGELQSTSNIEAAQKVGAEIARRAKEIGISQVAFDRSGFRYHGRVKALADAAREGGLEF